MSRAGKTQELVNLTVSHEVLCYKKEPPKWEVLSVAGRGGEKNPGEGVAFAIGGARVCGGHSLNVGCGGVWGGQGGGGGGGGGVVSSPPVLWDRNIQQVQKQHFLYNYFIQLTW